MSPAPGSTSGDAPRLTEIRHALVRLHKALVDYDRVRYEKTVGAIQSPNHFLGLLMRDPWFAWLHPLSELIVSMDQALDEKEPLTAATAGALIKEAGALLVPTAEGHTFSKHYFDALQDEPDVVLAHAAVVQLIRKR
jgi:hypothetical protein